MEEKETALTKEQARFDSLLQEMDDNATKAANDLDEQEMVRSEKEKAVLNLSEQLIVDLKLKEDL